MGDFMTLNATAKCKDVMERNILLDRLRYANIKPEMDGLTVRVTLNLPDGMWNLYLTTIYEIVMDAIESISEHSIEFTP